MGTTADEITAVRGSNGNNWLVYIILCSDNSLYTGITTDIDRRLRQHAEGRGARYFRGRQPLRVIYREAGHSRSSAAARELQIKALSRAAKISLIEALSVPAKT